MNLIKQLSKSVQEIVRVKGLLGFFVLLTLAGMAGFRLDEYYFIWARTGQEPVIRKVAEGFSYWGDFLPGTVPLCLAMGLFGFWKKSVSWQRIAWGCVLAAGLAGVLVNIVRLSAGRPRPSATLEFATERLGYEPKPLISFGRMLPDGKMLDGFYGPKRPAMFQGFPSGHSATAMGTATVLVIAAPALGAVIMPLALGVCWSRLYLRRHSISDVLVGGLTGIGVGMILGQAVRRLNH